MQDNDTIRLLKECNAGIKMAVKSFDEVLPRILDQKMKETIEDSKQAHEKIGDKTHELLIEFHDTEKEPNPIAEAMSWLKINTNCMLDRSEKEIAKLMIDGCNTGIKSISEYLNKYKAADEKIKNMVEDLIKLEQKLMDELRFYL